MISSTASEPTPRPTVKVLGLDPSFTNFGWALVEADNPFERIPLIASGRSHTLAKALQIDRLKYLREQVDELIERFDPDYIGVESPIFGASYSEGQYALFMDVNEIVRDQAKDIVYFSPGQLKARAWEYSGYPLGWIMNKAAMIHAASAVLGSPKRLTNDEADAFHCARSALRFWSFYTWESFFPEGLLTPVERHQFTRSHTFVRGKKEGKTVRSGLIYQEGKRFFLFASKDYKLV